MPDPRSSPGSPTHSARASGPSYSGATVVVVANRPLPDHPEHRAVVDRADLVIAANGGAKSAVDRGWLPDVVVGDMDSVDDATFRRLEARGCEILRFPRAKDETDLELALLEAVRRGAARITVLGALGGRVDHTLANLLLLALPALEGVSVRVLEGDTEIALVQDRAEIQGRIGDTVSLIPVSGDAVGITTVGLKWALCDGTLRFGLARGVSNVMTAPSATISLRHGLLLAIHMPPEPDQAKGVSQA